MVVLADHQVIVHDDTEFGPGLRDLAGHVDVGARRRGVAGGCGLPVDEKLIPALLKTESPYLGLIGSRRRWALTAKTLESQGYTREQLRRIHAPIGLELDAETPREIALSIMAEIIMLHRGADGKRMAK